MLREQISKRLRLAAIDTLGRDWLPTTQRAALLRRLGATIGLEPELLAARYLRPEHLALGDRVFVNYGCVLDARAGLTIEDDVSLAFGVTVLTTGHEIGRPARRAGHLTENRVKIGRGTWVGAGAILMPGVTVGTGCVIAAGSLITKDCEPHGLYVGHPAKRLRDLDH